MPETQPQQPCDIRLSVRYNSFQCRLVLLCKTHSNAKERLRANLILPRKECVMAALEIANKMAKGLDIKRWNDA